MNVQTAHLIIDMALIAAKEIYKELAAILLKMEGVEIVAQGHKATGSLIKSFDNPVVDIKGGIAINGLMNQYGLALEKKRKPGKPPPVSVLIKWIKTKGISSPNRTTRQIAFAMQEAIRREGIPTTGKKTPNGKGSFRFSKVGRRTAWLTTVLKEAEPLILKMNEKAVGVKADALIENMVRKIQKSL